LGGGCTPQHLVVLDVLGDEAASLAGCPIEDVLVGKAGQLLVGRHSDHVVPASYQLRGDLR
jgi:hypothetical protein